MKKHKGMAYAILGIAFVFFHVVAFAIPDAKTTNFWIAYVFTVVAFVLQIGIWKFAFKGAETIRSKFLGIPLISVGITYLLVQIIAFTVFTAFSEIPSWVTVIVNALILSVSAICLIATEVGRVEINRVEDKIDKKGFDIKSIQVDVEMLVETETDTDTKIALKKLAEKIRFSDPMSNEMLTEVEAEISRKVAGLKTAEDKKEIITTIDYLLSERNKKLQKFKKGFEK